MIIPHPSRIEQRLRAAIAGSERDTIQQATGWDGSQISRFLSGGMGVTIDKLDALLLAIRYVPVDRSYLDAMTTLGKVGMFCECARQGLGACGSCSQ